jgi:membrane-associated phospholipid phosphatase
MQTSRGPIPWTWPRLALLPVLLSLPVCGQQSAPNPHPATDPSHDLSGKEFVRDIGANFAALFSRRSIVPVIAGAAASGIATAPEQDLEKHFSRGDMWGGWADPGKYVGSPVVVAGVGATLFAVSRRSADRDFRSLSYSLLHGAIMSAMIVQSAKAGTQRLRPNGEDHSAFPSGHATDSFMAATVVADHYGWKAAIPGYLIATYVSATRLEERKHHLTDVTVGAAVGYLIGKTVSKRIHGGKESRFGLQVSPARRGFVCSVNIALP